ncbi:septal ring lytic transglycosylase RlpA family protein [Pacificimonas flava]|uniref:Endolytic peptidoglycan transglycosylase RlpA n=1 Tax=Pacificimonas flava TaxID=1234595 RepID=M2TDG2_9SPHN|nr:septal ring lytic transglycosylase RlpA family protein [Pacificimonas flava]EMD84549.1 Rare lipoprotein A precursor [Pacificimonas flava]MBB5279579.1 rare lipoprotein A [Pacificimonas flava]
MRAPLIMLVLPLALIALSACGGGGGRGLDTSVSGPVKVGNPYKVRGRWYYPKDDRDYRETGMASWYGPNFKGRPTANGERFDPSGLSAAHKTLPLPSFVRVENLNNGREVTVRVNDRGPFAENRIIDLSRRAAQLLDMEGAGLARVRVTRVYPSDEEKRALAALAPEPPQRVEGGAGDLYVQVAALSEAARARAMAAGLGRFGPAAVYEIPGGIQRVRLGPFLTMAEAETVLANVRRAGYTEARVVRDATS